MRTHLHPEDHAPRVRAQERAEQERLGFTSLEPISTALRQQRDSGRFDAFCAVRNVIEQTHWSVRWLVRLALAKRLQQAENDML